MTLGSFILIYCTQLAYVQRTKRALFAICDLPLYRARGIIKSMIDMARSTVGVRVMGTSSKQVNYSSQKKDNLLFHTPKMPHFYMWWVAFYSYPTSILQDNFALSSHYNYMARRHFLDIFYWPSTTRSNQSWLPMSWFWLFVVAS
jgi:hypothetical protein